VHGVERGVDRGVVMSCSVESQGERVVASDEVIHWPIRDTPQGPTMVMGGVQCGQDHPEVFLVGELVTVEAGHIDPLVVIASEFDGPRVLGHVHLVEPCDSAECVAATQFLRADRLDALTEFRIGQRRPVHLTRLVRIRA
jgi:hypothetical protein